MSRSDEDHAASLKAARASVQAGHFSAASAQLDEILKTAPENIDALYMRAVSARFSKDFTTARTQLSKLFSLKPEFGRAWQESGHLLRDQGDSGGALNAYQQATRYNPTLIAAWAMQAELNKAAGRPAAAQQAAEQKNRIERLPKPLLAASNDMAEGRIVKAEEIVRAFLQKNPKHTEGMRLLAEIGSKLGALQEAEFLLESAITFEPDNVQIRLDYMTVLRKRQKFDAAVEQADYLSTRDPESTVILSHAAITAMQAGNHDHALDLFDRILTKIPNDPATLTSRGHALKTCGRSDEAIAAYRAAYRALPGHGDAYHSLANLKTYRFTQDEIIAMETQLAREDQPYLSRVQFCFALGKACEDLRDHEKAFNYYAQGNALQKRQSRYSIEEMRGEFDAQKRYCTAEMMAAQSGKGHSAADPIFIVGLPRAGSTLIEQILASHSQVDGTLELPNILSLAHRLRGRNLVTDRDRYPRVLGDLSADQLQELGADYIENTRIHRQGAPFFTDKMPNNFRHIGLIHLILPNAKIIDARRAPMDCCWSGYKQLFAEGQEFTYGLEEIGHYYRGYVDLMTHWHSVLPDDRILQVQHEDVLDDLDGQVRRLLDYCGLPFENACVEFHQTDRAVRTASSEQVRQPINRAGQGQWQPYEDFLGPLKSALGRDLV